MKLKREIEINICDFCGVEEAYQSCHNCGKYVCADCFDDNVKPYRHSIVFLGNGDGLYCNECQKKLKETKDEKFLLFLELEKVIDNFLLNKKSLEEKAREIKDKLIML